MFGRRFVLFELFGFKVQADTSWLFLAMLVTWSLAKGYFPAFQARPEDCIHCALCCTMCPDVAITISEIVEEAEAQK